MSSTRKTTPKLPRLRTKDELLKVRRRGAAQRADQRLTG
jgi:hypothetical protein